MLTFDLDGSENGSDSISITVTAHVLMGVVISLPWDVFTGPAGCQSFRPQVMWAYVYLFHVGVVYVLVSEIVLYE